MLFFIGLHITELNAQDFECSACIHKFPFSYSNVLGLEFILYERNSYSMVTSLSAQWMVRNDVKTDK
jgi:hypothetical protein